MLQPCPACLASTLTIVKFQDFLYALGKEGGDDAAHQLYAELKKQLKSIYPDDSVADWSICVQVYLNLHGLALKLHACGIVSNPNVSGYSTLRKPDPKY